jgi:aminoglycoside phosphotransferase (APT) family kinase protein
VTADGKPAQACPPAQPMSADPPRKPRTPPTAHQRPAELQCPVSSPRERREAAHVFLAWVNRPLASVSAADDRARASLTSTDASDGLHDRIVATLAGMLGDTHVPPPLLHRLAVIRGGGTTGFYNHNIAITTPADRVLVRIPIIRADPMDLRVWPEAEVLDAIRPYVAAAPRLLHAGSRPRFQVHEYIDGELLDRVAPRGHRVPAHVIPEVCRFFADLQSVPRDVLPPTPPGWPEDGDSAAFAKVLADLTRQVYRTHQADYGGLFSRLGIPADPVEAAAAGLASLTARPSRLVHADVHRKNIILSPTGSRFIDWELAMWADPVYDLAAHLHKTAYLPDEQDMMLNQWSQAFGREHPGWHDDLTAYLRHERVKSTVVDSVRYSKAMAAREQQPQWVERAAADLARKLNSAYPVWNMATQVTPAEVEAALRAEGLRSR